MSSTSSSTSFSFLDYHFTSDKVVVNYGKLPISILRNIFQYLPLKELKQNILPVCQRWRAAAEYPELWKTLNFCGKHTPTNLICSKIWCFDRVNVINVWNSAEAQVIIRQICRCSKQLTHLTMRHCKGLTEDSLRHLLVSCKHLKYLDLKGTHFRSLIFFEDLALAKELTNLNFSDNPHMSISKINTTIMNCSNLEGFHVSIFRPNDKIMMLDTDCYYILLQLWKKLKFLSLDCSSMSSTIYPSILRCKYLEYLCLNYAVNLSGKDFDKIWKTLTKLTVLKVRFGHQIRDSHFKNMFDNGKKVLCNLEVCDFTGCSRFSDQGVEALAKCCTNLKCLILRACKKVTNISIVMKNCRKLEILNVAFCNNMKFDYVPFPNQLQTVYLSKDKNQETFANMLKKHAPHTVIKICVSEYNKRVTNA